MVPLKKPVVKVVRDLPLPERQPPAESHYRFLETMPPKKIKDAKK